MEILSNDLRIGNYFNYRLAGVFKVVKISNVSISGDRGKGVVDFSFKDITPETLTEQWLINFGFFIVETNGAIEATLPNFRYSIQTVENYEGFFFCDGENVLTNFNYVHELQNLIFALSKTELILKNS